MEIYNDMHSKQMYHCYRNLRWLIIAGLLLAYHIAQVIPHHWTFENGLLEWVQIGFLALGFFVCAAKARKASVLKEQYSKRFWLWMLIPWLVMICRELSWGRVLFPIGYNENGPILIPMEKLVFGDAIHAFVVLVVILWIYAVCKYKFYKLPAHLISNLRFPILEAILTFITFVYALLAAKMFHTPMVEEVVESIAFFGLVTIALRIDTVVNHKTSE